MTVSRRVLYAWTCPACHSLQRSAVWDIVDARERPDLLAQGTLAPGLVHVVCPRCGTGSPIEDRPVLVIRPGNDLPLLLGTTWADLASEDVSPATMDLYASAQLAMAGDELGVQPPVIPMPRSLLAIALARVPDDDTADPDLACGQVARQWSASHAAIYRVFLEDVRGSARIRAVSKLLQRAWTATPRRCCAFVEAHPDLSSPEVVAAVVKDFAAGPPPGASTAPLAARLRLVQSLAAGIPPRDAVDVYLQAMSDFAVQDLNPRVDALVSLLQANPSPDLIPQARETLALAVALGDTNLEASAASDLGVRLLRLPGNRGTEEAARLLTRALDLIAEDASHWAEVAGNLAHAVARRASGDPNENWAHARELLLRACAADPDANTRAWATGEVAEATAAAGDWDAAARTYERMLVAFESLFDAQLTAQGRRRTLERSPRLSRWAAYALARAGRHEQAVQAIEQGRARELTLSASRGTVELDALRQVDPALAARYEESLRAYAATAAQTDRLQEAPAARALSQAAADLQEAVEAVRAVPGQEQFLRPLSPANLLKATSGLPVAYLVAAAAGSCVLTVRPGKQGRTEIGAFQVPEVTGRSVAGLVLFDSDRGLPGILAPDPQGRQAALTRLGELTPLVEPVVTLLSAGGGKVVVVPTGLLGLVPLHAVPVTPGRVLDDEGEIHLAPSVAVYGACRLRARQPRTAHLVGVADTDPLHPLPASRREMGFVEDLFGQFESPSTRTGASAARQWLLDEAVTASHLHLACHGSSSLQARFGGELVLGDGVLTMTDLNEIRLVGCRLVVASACQSGHYDTALSPDEFLGLPGGFLQAGAACVVASLWKVDDVATAVLMMRFYELLDPGPEDDRPAPRRAVAGPRPTGSTCGRTGSVVDLWSVKGWRR